jgi:hypothetical protein
MAGWGNNNQSNYGNNNYADNRNYNNNRGYNNSSNQPRKKRNGCKSFTGKNGNDYISGWYFSPDAGLVKVLVFRTKNSDEVHTSKSGKDWVSVAAKVTWLRTGQIQTFNALLDVQARRVSIKDINFILSVNKNYCGPAFKKK